MNKWSTPRQMYVLEVEYKGIPIKMECSRPIIVLGPPDLKALCHPPEPKRMTVAESKRRGKIQVINKPDQDRYNSGLGVQQRHVKEKLRVIAGETGRHLQEVGNEKQKDELKTKPFTVTRNEVDWIKEHVK